MDEGKTVRIGRVTLGKGTPAICVPVMGGTMDEIARSAARAAAAKADVMELRIDSLSPMPTRETAKTACRAARSAAEDIPILFTLRTARDGGRGDADTAAYEGLLMDMIASGACESVDCELSVGEEAFARIAWAARDAGVTLVGSSHEFGEIGDMRRAAHWLKRQQALGADVCKAAVMTRTRTEALELALIYAKTAEELRVPMIGIAMGRCGAITRVGGAMIGSCLTFGTAGNASAPGQIDARRLRTAMDIIQDALGDG